MTPETLRIIDTFSPVELDLWARRGGEVPVQRREELRQWQLKQANQNAQQHEESAVASILSMRREAEAKAKATKRRKAKP